MAVLHKKRENGSLRVSTVNQDISRCEQSKLAECNINEIMKRARKGIPPRIQENRGCYGDFSDRMDFMEALTRVADAKSDFMSLPSEVRTKFDNDVSKLIEFIADPANAEQAQELGLLPEGLTHQEAVQESAKADPEAPEADPEASPEPEVPPESA